MALIRETASVLGLALVLTACATTGQSPGAQARAQAIRAALQTGDTARAFQALVDEYAAAGLQVSPSLQLHTLAVTDPISHYQAERQIIHATRMPAPSEGRVYWAQWASSLTAGRWNPDDAIGDEHRQQQLGAYTVLGVLAHEIGHHLNHIHGARGETASLEEYGADRLAIGILNGLTRDPDLHVLLTKYRSDVLRSLWTHLPAAAKPALPPVDRLEDHFREVKTDFERTPAGIVGLVLARQTRLLDAPAPLALPDLVERLHTSRSRRQAARRYADGWTVTTLGPVVLPRKFGLDAAGRVWAVTKTGTTVTLSHKADTLSVDLGPDGAGGLSGALAFGAGGWAIGAGTRIWLLKDGKVIRSAPFKGNFRRVGVSVDGRLFRMGNHAAPGTRATAFSELLSSGARILAIIPSPADRDNPTDHTLEGAVRGFAVDAQQRVVFVDTANILRRTNGKTIETLAGGLPGHADGPGPSARIQGSAYYPIAISETGLVTFLGADYPVTGNTLGERVLVRQAQPAPKQATSERRGARSRAGM